MTDPLSPSRRSWNMGRIRSGDTKPELVLRSLLHRCGFRFSLRRKDLPGRPDIVLPKYGSVLFVHGCFWHRHPGCPQATTPGSRRDFWLNKFARTVERDAQNQQQLRQQGWQVIVVWECELMAAPGDVVRGVIERLCPDREPAIRYSQLPERREILKLAEKRLQYRLDREKSARD